jgi:hypothetical protein
LNCSNHQDNDIKINGVRLFGVLRNHTTNIQHPTPNTNTQHQNPTPTPTSNSNLPPTLGVTYTIKIKLGVTSSIKIKISGRRHDEMCKGKATVARARLL